VHIALDLAQRPSSNAALFLDLCERSLGCAADTRVGAQLARLASVLAGRLDRGGEGLARVAAVIEATPHSVMRTVALKKVARLRA